MKRRSPERLHLKALAWVGEYDLAPGDEQREYRIQLSLVNPTSGIVRFDTVEATISPPDGPPLKVTLNAKPQPDGEGILELGPGESWTRGFNTNGYTILLITQARGAALLLAVTVKRRALRIDGPFHGFLHDLSDLPEDFSGPFSFGESPEKPGKPVILGARGQN